MLELLKDLWTFMKERKKFWLAPIIIILLLLGSLLGGYAGAHLAILKGNRWIKRVFEIVQRFGGSISAEHGVGLPRGPTLRVHRIGGHLHHPMSGM